MKYIPCIFFKEEAKKREPSPMPGVDYHTLSSGIQYINKYFKKGISDFLVFGSTSNKSIDFACSDGLIVKFIEKSKNKFGNKIKIFADVGLSPYSRDGHSTVMEDGKINYSKSYFLASKLAIAFAKAGADYIAPCLSLHNQVKELRKSLDGAGLKETKIMAYSAKFSSVLYGPYRATIQSPLRGNDKKIYQMDYSSSKEGLNQIVQDQKQGADIVMVKPAMLYLDIVFQARKLTKLPLSVYHVSGEYSMIKEAVKTGLLDERGIFDELHAGFKRCGADYVIGYAPDHFLRWNNKKN
ncbi:MAG: porphobilinogen synthase [Candidatus Buchananbacteria bacterium]